MRFFETKNYDDFVMMKGNRDIDEPNVKRFMKIIQEGKLYDEVQVNPTKMNGKWVIVDGQHKFTALKRLGKAVPVIVKRTNVPLKGVVDINTQRKNWTDVDRVRSYSELGNENYTRLYNIFLELNKVHSVTINTVAKMCHGSLAQSDKAEKEYNLKGGNWVFKKTESDVRKVFNECVKFTKRHPDCMSATFINCIQSLMENQEGFSIKRLLESSRKNPHKFLRCATKPDMLRMLEELYNFNREKKSRLYFNINKL